MKTNNQKISINRRAVVMEPPPPTIDLFIPHPDVRERHEILVRAPAELVLDVARQFDMQSLPLVRVIFWLRAKLLGAQTPKREQPKGLVQEMLGIGWRVLAAQPGRLLILGAACQPWRGDVVFTAIPNDRFAAYAEPGCVKIAWTLEAQELRRDVTRFVTETRAVATDNEARARFRRYWRQFGLGTMVIRRLLLAAVRRQAEHHWPALALPRVD